MSFDNSFSTPHYSLPNYDDFFTYGSPSMSYRYPMPHIQSWWDPQPTQIVPPNNDSELSSQSLSNQEQQKRNDAYKKQSDVQAEKPDEPSLLPRPGLAAIVAGLSMLSNNQFRPNDDPLGTFLNAYAGAKQDQYRQQLSQWQNKSDAAAIAVNQLNSQADMLHSQSLDAKAAEATKDQQRRDWNTKANKYRADLARAQADPNGISESDMLQLWKEYNDVANDQDAGDLSGIQKPFGSGASNVQQAVSQARANDTQTATNQLVPLMTADHAASLPYMPVAATRTQTLIKQAQSDNASRKPGTARYAWETPGKSGLTPIQDEMGNTYHRSATYEEMVHLMKLHGYDTAPLDSPQGRAYAHAVQALNASRQDLSNLGSLIPSTPNSQQQQAYIKAAQAAVKNQANEKAVANRLRWLMIGGRNPGGDGFADLVPKKASTTMHRAGARR